MEHFADEIELAQFHADQFKFTELAIAEVRKRSEAGEGREFCLDCGCRMPDQRLLHMHNATRCMPCQSRQEALTRRLS